VHFKGFNQILEFRLDFKKEGTYIFK